MNRKKKLARLILMEYESLKENSIEMGSLQLAEQLTKDAIELAKLIIDEEE